MQFLSDLLYTLSLFPYHLSDTPQSKKYSTTLNTIRAIKLLSGVSMKNKSRNKQIENEQRNSFIFEELEARQLFSGGIEGLIDTDLESSVIATYIEENNDSEKSTDEDSEDSTTTAAEQQSREIVFVDTGVEDYQTLINDVLSNADSSNISIKLNPFMFLGI